MKALVVKEPWASLIVTGKKKIEYRTWITRYRGPLLICVAKDPPSPNSGHAVCVVDLVCVKHAPVHKRWILKNPRRIRPFPVRGMPGLFEVNYKKPLISRR